MDCTLSHVLVTLNVVLVALSHVLVTLSAVLMTLSYVLVTLTGVLVTTPWPVSRQHRHLQATATPHPNLARGRYLQDEISDTSP